MPKKANKQTKKVATRDINTTALSPQPLVDFLGRAKIYFFSLLDPVCNVIFKNAESVLDVGCGPGLPMRMINMRMKVKQSVGVDIFDPYLKECKENKIHTEYVKADIRKLPFKDKTFDVVMALQVLEHLHKKEAWQMLNKMEKIAKKQVIIATPIGDMYHPAVDGNEHQLHHSSFYPEEFEKKGYAILKMGRKSLLGEEGIVHKLPKGILRELAYVFSLVLDLISYFYQPTADYYFIAYKKIH